MHDLLPAVEKNSREISQRTARALGVLGAAESIPGPALYHQVIRNISEIRPVWAEHIRLLSQAYPLISSETDRMAIAVLRQFQEDIAETAHWLETLSSAGWARTPAIGVNSIRVRAAQTLGNILRQMEKERTTIVPLLRRSMASRKVEAVPVVQRMATA
jgi:hypothetical protein